MRERILHHSLVIGFGLIVAHWCGCIAMYQRHDVVVQVRDATTLDPVAGAQVKVSYPGYMMVNTPDPDTALTGLNGQASMRLATWDSGLHWTVRADGYQIEYGDGGPSDHPRRSYMGEPYMLVAPNAETVVDLMRDVPKVRMVVPMQYVGRVRLMFDASLPADDLKWQPKIRIDVAADEAIIRVPSEGVARTISWKDAEFEYADGTPISGVSFKVGQIWPYWLGSDSTRTMWYVGYQPEAVRLQRYIFQREPGIYEAPRRFDEARFGEVFERGFVAIDQSE